MIYLFHKCWTATKKPTSKQEWNNIQLSWNIPVKIMIKKLQKVTHIVYSTVKHVYNNHPWDLKKWSLYRGGLNLRTCGWCYTAINPNNWSPPCQPLAWFRQLVYSCLKTKMGPSVEKEILGLVNFKTSSWFIQY